MCKYIAVFWVCGHVSSKLEGCPERPENEFVSSECLALDDDAIPEVRERGDQICPTCVKEDAAALQKQQAKEMKAAKKKKAAEKEVKMRLEKVAGWQKDQQHLEET